MKHLKLFEEYRDFNQEYHLDDFYFKVSNGGPIEGTEIGDITVHFDKDGEEGWIVEFEVYQPASGDWGVTCEDYETASELGIELDERGKVLDDDLTGELLDAYGSGGGEGEWNDMTFVVEDVSPKGVIEEGWLLITIYKDGREEEVQFEVRQEALNSRTDQVEPQGDDDLEKLKELGIDIDEDFEFELLKAYDDYSNFIRP